MTYRTYISMLHSVQTYMLYSVHECSLYISAAHLVLICDYRYWGVEKGAGA
jgi:hypothetical protein